MRLYYLITREVECLEVQEAVQRAVVDLGDLVVAEDEDAEAGGGLELAVGQVEAGQGTLVPAQAHVLHILHAVVREVEVDEALEAAQLLVRQPPQARVGEVEPRQSAQPRQRPGSVCTLSLASNWRPARLSRGSAVRLQCVMLRSRRPARCWRLRAASRDSWPTSSAHWMESATVPLAGITLKSVWSYSEYSF